MNHWLEIGLNGIRARARSQLLVLCMLVSTASSAQLREGFVDPTSTDPAIVALTELPGSATRRLDHFAVVDAGRRNGYLYVHLPGSGGLPENSLSFARHAAGRGFHVVSLAYPNWPSVNELTANGGDSAEPGRVREERLFGTNASVLVDVDAANSIWNRLVRLLEHLDTEHPEEGWGRFLIDGAPDVARTVIGGHSQGAGHAAYLGQEFRLAGVLMLGGPGDFVAGVGLADWLFRPSPTGAGRYYGFVHELDPSADTFRLAQLALGLGAFGPLVDVDQLPPDAWSSNRLTSSRQDIPTGNYHGAVVVDAHLPRNPDGTPAYAHAWNHLLGSVLFTDSMGD